MPNMIKPIIAEAKGHAPRFTEISKDGAGRVISQAVKDTEGKVYEAIKVDYSYMPKLVLHAAPGSVTKAGTYQGMKGEIVHLADGTVGFRTSVVENGKKINRKYLFSSQEAFEKGEPLEIRGWDERGNIVELMKLDYKRH